MLELAELISQTFPTERVETYYMPYSGCSGTKKKSAPKGKLHDKHGEYRSMLIKAQITEAKKGRKRKSDNSGADSVRTAVLGYTHDWTSNQSNYLL